MQRLISKWQFHSGYSVPAADGYQLSISIPADVIFAALAAQSEEIGDVLRRAVIDGKLRLSDALPFVGENYYLPTVRGSGGFLTVSGEVADLPFCEEILPTGRRMLPPFRGGLYLLIDLDISLRNILEHTIDSLSNTGIGARRSAGWGQFQADSLVEAPGMFCVNHGIGPWQTLAPVYPEDLETVNFKRCRIAMLPRHQQRESDHQPNLFLASGSIFEEPFCGCFIDEGENPGLPKRYAYPFWWEMKTWNA